MRAFLLLVLVAAVGLIAFESFGTNRPEHDVAASRGPAETGSGEQACASIVFLGHAYPLNGFDKRKYGNYLGWKADTLPQQARGGASIRMRLENNADPARLRRDFYDPLAELAPTRWVWGGDAIYTKSAKSVAHMLKLVDSYRRVPQVYLPGNHDWRLLASEDALALFERAAGEDELLAGTRILYVDTVTEDGVLMAPRRAHSAPSDTWLARFRTRISEDRGERGLLILMHHAPWFLERTQANVKHRDSPWWTEMHAILKDRVAGGLLVLVIAGDGGDRCMADGREIDGVRYCVTGQPRYDSETPNGFLRCSWTETSSQIAVDVFTWTALGGLVEHPAPAFPWRY